MKPNEMERFLAQMTVNGIGAIDNFLHEIALREKALSLTAML